MGEITYISKAVEDTEMLGKIIAKYVNKGLIICLNGELASGKTAISRVIFNELGFSDGFCSPSYTIINQYVANSKIAYHMDVYRLECPEELLYTGFYDCLEQAEFTVIEWASMIEEIIAHKDRLILNFSYSNIENERIIQVLSKNEDLLLDIKALQNGER